MATAFEIAPALAAEIFYINDDDWIGANNEQRWKIVRDWVSRSTSGHAERKQNES